MLQDVLSNHTPDFWTTAHYDQQFVKLALNHNDEEYQRVVGEFKGINVAEVHRIQNPYIWGRFKLRKEQLQRQSVMYEHICYHPIRAEDANIVAEYNCDYRRYTGGANGSQYANKRPNLYKQPIDAKQTYTAHAGRDCPAMVVVRVIHPNANISDIVLKDWDTEYVPEYIVTLL